MTPARTTRQRGPEKLFGQPLTARECQILEGVALGLSNVKIGADLNLSPLTVKSHLHRIHIKLGGRNRAHLVALGYRTGQLLLLPLVIPETPEHPQVTLAKPRRPAFEEVGEPLTPRESEVLRLFGLGLQANDVARRLRLPPHVVKATLGTAAAKFGTRSRARAIAEANGVVPEAPETAARKYRRAA